MRRHILLMLACVAVVLSSCSTMKQSSSTAVNVETGVFQYPTVADLEVKAKVEKTVRWNFMIFNIGEPSVEQRKSNLMAEVVKESGGDVLLEPQFIYTKKPFGQRTLTITGYPASYKNFRQATADDLKALEVVAPAHEKKVIAVSQPWYKRIFSKKSK